MPKYRKWLLCYTAVDLAGRWSMKTSSSRKRGRSSGETRSFRRSRIRARIFVEIKFVAGRLTNRRQIENVIAGWRWKEIERRNYGGCQAKSHTTVVLTWRCKCRGHTRVSQRARARAVRRTCVSRVYRVWREKQKKWGESDLANFVTSNPLPWMPMAFDGASIFRPRADRYRYRAP